MSEQEVNSQNSNKPSDKAGSEPSPSEMTLNEIERSILSMNPRAFTGISNTKKNELLKTFTKFTHFEISRSFSGPLPSPEILRQYHEIDPMITKTITEMAVQEMVHTHQRDKLLIEQTINLKRRGQNCAVVIALTTIISGAVCIVFVTPRSTTSCVAGVQRCD